MMKRSLRVLLSCLLFFGVFFPVLSSHIRAGEITAERITSSTFRFTLTIYANWNSSVRDDFATFDFGDGTTREVLFNSQVRLTDDTYRRTYTTNKTYGGAGTYQVSYFERFRNAGIRNMTIPDNTIFYVSSFVTVSPFLTVNNPVQLRIPPIDQAARGEIFVHNAGAFDPDGDSLSFRLTVPSKGPNQIVDGYFTPSFSNSFSLNPITGDLTWNAPTILGLYNIAFVIEEWRKGVNGQYSRVGFVTRDMQINVINTVNNPPILEIPDDTCVVAGSLLIKTIRAIDPDGNSLEVTATPSTYFTAVVPQNSPATGIFSWSTTCADIRAQPYLITFKAKDRVFNDTLTTYKTWQVKVKGPMPTGLLATPLGTTLRLSWNPYTCLNAQRMEIYRSECDSSVYEQEPCETGDDGYPGFRKIGEVPIGTFDFFDSNNGEGLKRGVSYCYLIVAQFPLPFGGESYASQQTCSELPLNVPLINRVTVVQSSTTAGEILLDWDAPTASPLIPPYSYTILRAEGATSAIFIPIASGVLPPFTDIGLSTNQVYRYQVQIDGGGFSDPSTNTVLSLTPSNQALTLTWEKDVPWATDSIYIWRILNGGIRERITTLYSDPSTYFDANGLENCDSVCYQLQVFSSYCDEKVVTKNFVNFSQERCGSPADDRAPIAPELSVKGCDGDLTIFFNELDWSSVSSSECNTIRNYNVYFSEYETSDFSLLATTDFTVTDYRYNNPITTAGCFQVAAVNFAGVEGGKSNRVCVDDCVYYELPNLITPNGDSLNDLFRPFPIPRGVELVFFKVYNRWGALVYSIDNNINLNWNAISSNAQKVSDGIYYFSAEIKYFRRKEKKDEVQLMKGWVHVLNNTVTQPLE